MDENSVLLPIVKALVSAVPVVGGSFASVIGDVSEAKYKKRLEDSLKQMTDALNDVKANVDANKASSDDFKDIFVNTMQEIIQNRADKKREALTCILVNTIAYNNISFDDSEYLVNIINSLTIQHLLCLEELSTVNLQNVHNYDEVVDNFLGAFTRKYSCSTSVLLDLIQDLEYQNLVDGFMSHYYSRGGSGGVVKVGISSYLTGKGTRLLKNINI